ncbi:MAG: L,D-transpeptidase [Melioribacter sp.]|nr:L,D-transpeptidase [Melioribacter sp.]
MLKNILYISGSVVIFFAGMILYGVILNFREVTLKEALIEKGLTKLENIRLVVDKTDYKILLYSNKILIKTYKAVFGKSSGTIKSSADDNITPLGDYKICAIDSLNKYHKFLHLDYPNERDAAEALKQGYIFDDEFNTIILAAKKNECPPKETKLGSEIGIHGIGTYNIIFKNLPFSFNWTNGSIAVSNENIDELYSVIKIGTPVKIIN